MAWSALVIVFFPPWSMVAVAVYWTSRASQRYRRQVEDETGETFEGAKSLGLPFTSRW